MNLEFLVVALVVGRTVDWIFQSKYQAENKTSNLWILFEHSMFYSLITTWVVILIVGIPPSNPIATFIWFVFLLSHMIIDNRFFVKFLMYLKGLTREEVNSKEYGWLQVGIDQRLHDLIILGIAVML